MTDTISDTCSDCGLSLIPLVDSAFFVRRRCVDCGKDTFLFDKDPKNSGMRVMVGDQPQVNVGLLLKRIKIVGGVQFSRAGLSMFVRARILPTPKAIRDARSELPAVLDEWDAKVDSVLRTSPLLQHLDLDSEEGVSAAHDLIEKQHESAESIAFLLKIAGDATRASLDAGDAWSAAGSAAVAAGASAMLVFKNDIEEAAWRGHSVETLRSALTIWENNRNNDGEEFWQQTLAVHSVVMSQVFSTPVLMLAGKAYVGGKAVDNSGGHISDFLLANAFTTRAAIVELKVPTTVLLSAKPYRNGIYAPSAELVGAVAQVSGYAASLAEDMVLRHKGDQPLEEPARSECLVIIGTAEAQLKSKEQRRSFELYRAELRNVRVVTFDELFHRVAELLKLFGG